MMDRWFSTVYISLYALLISQSMQSCSKPVVGVQVDDHGSSQPGQTQGHKGSNEKRISCTERVERLGKAVNFFGKATGYGNNKSDDFVLYENVLLIGPTCHADLKGLLQTGSPAGRLYAALVLQNLFPVEGNQALKNMSTDEALVRVDFDGCKITTEPVREVAEQLLKDPTIRPRYFE